MRQLTGTVAGLVGLAALMAGCGSDTPAESSSREVTVVGTGQVQGAPDTLDADLGVEVTGADVSGAIAAANTASKAVTDAMVAAGVQRADIRTTEVTLQSETGPDRAVTGFRATNTVRATIRDLGKASSVLGAAVTAGGNDVRIHNVSYAIEDDTKLLSDARSRAFADAKSRAEQYAGLAGLKLRDVKSINEAPSSGPAPAPRGMQAMPEIPLEPGTQTVSFTVTATWSLG
ncbi:SIMPL domain-containing protein [Nocardia stercoris]|uniref:DUF541 domain-containing protein n=1 Tax=Nocardia stercoris TaxID=2483361 RepID=A0A3M2LEE9_9NOCA|nr:SIMPL domain-containing protein [Nocardia stercoris]RMI34365.1 DUF541 domain-containing protein [Nocardia stercoris]